MDARKFFTDLNDSYIFMERYMNSGSPSGFTEVNKTSEETNPFTGKSQFPIFYFDDSDLESYILGEELPEFWSNKHNFAHPDSVLSRILNMSNRILRNSEFEVSPTSGGRTMFVWNRYPSGYLKLTYDVSRIGRVDRQLSKKHCLASCESSQTLKRVFDKGGFPNTMSMQLEPSAKVTMLPVGNDIYEWGVIFREKTPYPYIKKKVQLIPGFSLFYEKDNEIKNPLIIQFIRLGGYDPLVYLRRILTIIVDCYWNIVLNCGFHIECHGQNCLFEVDENYNIVRMVVKDMDSVDKDIPLAEFLGLNTNWESYPQCCFDRSLYFYDIRASYMYDFKLGEYLISPIINVVAKEYNLDVKQIQRYVRDYVNSIYTYRLPPNYFPPDGFWYYCDNTERKPGTRRTYYPHPNPNYR
ncbi:hypothetical protein EDD76_10543 [Kineothrix alysoides]|uniref:Siderophore synthetase component n=1 Tax=Kineothrix alysoides TaxID=1469948 RepID=A0A4R1R0N5_9FIRM|nr:hypothetical protein [Kineothrix alysoides]TCL58873.1 hypothetical protein EDD76_10543 [Kineothrix alysoides]